MKKLATICEASRRICQCLLVATLSTFRRRKVLPVNVIVTSGSTGPDFGAILVVLVSAAGLFTVKVLA